MLKARKQTQLSPSRYPRRVAQVTIAFSVIALGVAFLHPFAKESSYATDSDVSVSYSGEDWVISAPTSTAADAGGLEFDIEGNPNGVNMAKKDTVTAGSTNVPNYQIYVSVDTEGGKIPNTSNADYSIAATSGTVTDATDSSKLSGADALSNNSWGYALASFNSSINYNDLVSSSSSESWSSSKWSKLPYIASASKDDEDAVESTAAKIYDSTTGSGGSVDVYYAVNANNDLASGEYQTTVTYTLIGEMPTTTLKEAAAAAGITTMQGMEGSSVCSNASVWQEGEEDLTLTDTRDNESYVIRKLADGNCWMVQNFRMTKDTLSAAGHSTTLDSSDTNLTSTTYTMPNNASWQNTSATAEGAADASLLPKGSKTGAKATGTEALAHGAYYSWATAVADASSTGTSVKKTTSICPKGWKLPDSDGSTSTTTNQFQKLYNAYGSATSFNQAFNTYYSNGATHYLAGIWWSNNTQYVGNVGSDGYWWSSTSSSEAGYAWDLYATTSDITSTHDDSSQSLGFSMRCVFGS